MKINMRREPFGVRLWGILTVILLLTACGGGKTNTTNSSSSLHSELSINSTPTASSVPTNSSAVSSNSPSSSKSPSSSNNLSSTVSISKSSNNFSSSSFSISVSVRSVSSSLISSTASVLSSATTSSITSSTQASAERAVENTFVETEWIFCSPQYTGAGCTFEGLHVVRFGVGSKWVTKRVLNEMAGYQCSPAEFGSDPAPNEQKHCEYGKTMITGTIAAPIACHMGGLCQKIDLTAIPIGSTGSGELRIQNTDEQPANGDGIGAFRTMCGFSHMAFDDPIVYPGQPGLSHLHAFFGNVGTNAHSTATSIANSGNSTCIGGIANRSAYWVPALIDTTNGKPVVSDSPIWYYKTGYGGVAAADVHPMPSGLRMIAGSMTATDKQPMVYWGCFEPGDSRGASIPNCAVGLHVVMAVQFPQCWDGVNLDSPNHKSHMAYPTVGVGCPSTHPVAIPEITLNVKYLVRTENEPTHWRLSSDNLELPAGYSAHADWFDGWNPDVRDAWVTNCDQPAKDCHAHLLGNGTMLY